MNKYSFNISWDTTTERFFVKLLCDGEVVETNSFEGHMQALEYVSETMSGLLIAGEDWTFSY